MKSTMRTGPLLKIWDITDIVRGVSQVIASKTVVRSSRKRMREELELENVETTKDQPMETESSGMKDVGTQTLLSGDVFQSNYEHTKHVEPQLRELKMKMDQLAPGEDISVKLNTMDAQIKELQTELKESCYDEDAFKQSNERFDFTPV